MGRWKKYMAVVAVGMLVAAQAAGCGSTGSGQQTGGQTAGGKTAGDISAEKTEQGTDAPGETPQPSADKSAETDSGTKDISMKDPEKYEGLAEYTLTLNGSTAELSGGGTADGSVVTITEEGCYTVKGTLDDGQIILDGKDIRVKLVLDGADITCADSAPIYMKQGKGLMIQSAEGSENHISDGTSYTYTDEENKEPNAAIFSKGDILLGGYGTVNIDGNFNNGISSKDILQAEGGTWNVSAANDGVKGNDALYINDGEFSISSMGDGIASDGYLEINDGEIRVSARGGEASAAERSSKGIKALGDLTIGGGVITVEKATEGIESKGVMTVNGATVRISCTDDGLNTGGGNEMGRNTVDGAADGSHDLIINGGYIYVDAAGDGIDSNGCLTINDGVVIVNGPVNNGDGPLDTGTEVIINGGIVAVAGSSGMFETPSVSSGQCSVSVVQSGTAGSTVALLDENGKAVISMTPSKNFGAFLLSAPSVEQGQTYTVSTGGTVSGDISDGVCLDGVYTGGQTVAEVEMTDTSMGVGTQGMNGRGGMGGDMGARHAPGMGGGMEAQPAPGGRQGW